MFLPYSDENPTRSFPYFTLLLIAINCFVFYLQIYGQTGFDQLIQKYALVPCTINADALYNFNLYVPFFSHLFLHAHIIHIASNMLFLWIFGNNIEDVLGAVRFYAFYLLCGLAAAMTYYLFHYNECIPIVGASGAVSGLLGAYVILFPSARIRIWMLFFIFRMRAWVFVLLWFVIQVINLQAENLGMSQVAWSAHIGGFVAGFILIIFFRKRY